MHDKEPRRGIQSVEIAFRILRVMQTSRQAMALKDIAPLARLTTSATHNYLVSLVKTGLAAADEKPGCYRLGPAALSLGISAGTDRKEPVIRSRNPNRSRWETGLLP
jgi:DNA-binding IclR family transcriptional regulator